MNTTTHECSPIGVSRIKTKELLFHIGRITRIYDELASQLDYLGRELEVLHDFAKHADIKYETSIRVGYLHQDKKAGTKPAKATAKTVAKVTVKPKAKTADSIGGDYGL